MFLSDPPPVFAFYCMDMTIGLTIFCCGLWIHGKQHLIDPTKSMATQNNTNDNDFIASANAHENFAMQAIAQKKYQVAETHLYTALNIKTRLQQTHHIASVDIGLIHKNLGTVNKAMHRYHQAVHHFREAWIIYSSYYGTEFPFVRRLYDLHNECFQSAVLVDAAASYPVNAGAA